ncbi:MAG: hypothetical protein K8J08_13160 [Thermoanaerobaculia bacterium]|nr:hypothetical protein [Thermoanaerobaculia bacterium]
MSVIPITIIWDAKTAKIVDVSPDPVRLTWIDNDIAQFILKSKGDDKAEIVDIWFEGKDRKGPFAHLAATPHTSDKAWTGSQMAHVTKEYKYSLKIKGTNGEYVLDPRMQTAEGP